mmetsp:Transcript_31350/g.22713  ORF Transcript_31350/g.22713 Transcript_31350/m.22713 type:complete len:162 (+) Transcript_31350:569-1054(+)
MIGGGTLLGLSNLLTGINDFDTIVKMAPEGDNSKVDMLVKDIYGENSPFKELQGDLLASSFAKMAFDQNQDEVSRPRKEDVMNSLITMISFNIGQLAYYSAVMHNIKNIYFIGSYVRNNPLAMEQIMFAVDFMSGGTKSINPHFINFDGYLGAIGAFMYEF